jgi:hypothetical protein
MPEIRINNKVLVTQTGAAEPVLASNVNLGSATFPDGHTLSYHFSSLTGTFDTDTNTSYQDTGSEIMVPAAFVALGSKILLTFNHMFRVNVGTSNALIDIQVIRTTPSSATLQSWNFVGVDGTAISTIKFNFDKTIVDSSLGTGDHTYKLQYRKANGSTTNAGGIYYKAGNQNTHYIFARVVK